MRFNLKKTIILVLTVSFFLLVLKERYNVVESTPETNFDEVVDADCGVVLTGSSGRLKEAFDIYTKGKLRKLIVSGVYKNTTLKEIFPQVGSLPLEKVEDIILEKISGTTQQNAVQSLQISQLLKCQNILLITSKIHMYRALKTFKNIYPASYDIRIYPVVNPNKAATEYEILYETLKSMFYSVMFLINIESF